MAERDGDQAGDDPIASTDPAAADIGGASGQSAAGDYEVGYGRPPRHGRIQKGEVRNKRGKAKGTRSHKKDVREVLDMPVPIMTPKGRRKYVPTSTFNLMKLRELAFKGNIPAILKMIDLAAAADADLVTGLSTKQLLAEDAAILAAAETRERKTKAAADPAPEHREDQPPPHTDTPKGDA